MTITSGIVLYAVCWFMILYMILPLFVRNQEEAGRDIEPGTSAGAPDEPMMRKKLIWTTAAATVAWVVLYLIITSGWVTIDEITRWMGRPE